MGVSLANTFEQQKVLQQRGFIFDNAFFSQNDFGTEIYTIFANIFKQLTEGIVILDANLNFVAVNRQFLDIMRLPADDIIGRYFSYHPIKNYPPYHKQFFRDLEQHLLERQDFEQVVSLAMRGGSEVFVNIRMVNHQLSDQSMIHLGFVTDVSRHSKLLKNLTQALNYDKLTGLQTLDYFLESTKLFINYLESSPNSLISLVLLRLNIDKLQSFNESLGIHTTDKLIQKFVERVKTVEVVGTSVQAFSRFGGDNFALLLNVSDIAQAYSFLDKLSQAFELPFILNERYIYMRISVGVAVYPNDTKTAESLVIQAESALKHARLSGGDDIVWYDKVQQKTLFHDVHLRSAFNRALEKSQIVPFFQPKFMFNQPNVPMFEALVRWQHPELGTLAPHEFLDEVLDGLSQPLFETIIQLCADQIIIWKKMGYHAKACINIDARQLNNDRFIKFLDEMLARYRWLSQHIEFELTEIARLIDKPKALAVIYKLRDAGITLAIDDFGTGYASLSYLIDYPVDLIKLDKIFIKNVHQEPRKQSLVKSIIHIAHSLEFDVIAEGVETQEELDFLKQIGCDGAQGYYYGRPMSAQSATQWLKSNFIADPAIAEDYHNRYPNS